MRFKAIAETTPVGIGVIGIPEGKFLYVNQAYQEAFGYSEAELLGKSAPDIYYSQEDRKRILRLLKENNNSADYEVKLRKKDGSAFWASICTTNCFPGQAGVDRLIHRHYQAHEG